MEEKRLRIVTGYCGSGKTEFAVNYVLHLAGRGCKTAIVDLDTINPYFRSREIAAVLKQSNIRVIASSINTAAADIPSLSPEIFTVLQDRSYHTVFDLGGGRAGVKILRRYHHYLEQEPYEMFFVLNSKRRFTSDIDSSISQIKEIEAASGQKITAIVNNTHLCESTTESDILQGQELCEAVAKKTGLPVAYTVIKASVAGKLAGKIKNELCPISIYMKKPWEVY